MEPKSLMNGLRKILKTCYRNGFFYLQSSEHAVKTVEYGPLGSLFRRNVWREWLSSIVNNTDVCMFPIEALQSRNHLKYPQLEDKQHSFLHGVLKKYFKTVSFVGMENPWGFAIYGFEDLSIKNSEILFGRLRQLDSRNCLSIIFFCPVKKSTDWFNYWARYRYRWWRKFSSVPSKFSMSDVTETVAGDQQVSLMMEFPWGKENLETITLYNENFFKATCQALVPECIKTGNTTSAVIVCQSELDLAAFAYLSNSFTEKWRYGKIGKLLHLHVKLAPYKVCISIDGDNAEDLKNLKDVAKHLEKEMKKCRMAVFPCFDTFIKDNTTHLRRYDEMGIPYTIILNNKALHSGIAALRNRDTTLEEQIHITELTPKLLKYLQMKSYEVDE